MKRGTSGPSAHATAKPWALTSCVALGADYRPVIDLNVVAHPGIAPRDSRVPLFHVRHVDIDDAVEQRRRLGAVVSAGVVDQRQVQAAARGDFDGDSEVYPQAGSDLLLFVMTTDAFGADISRKIWASKYRQADEPGIRATWRRVAEAMAAVERAGAAAWRERFRELLDQFTFLPGGHILAGAGTGRRVTLFNCFVMGIVENSMDGIFDALKEGALTMQQGGGVGYDFSTLRPHGTPAQAGGGIASGPVSFMRIWDSLCDTLLSTGARRGAMMATLRCDHPDIETFIDAKRDRRELRNFNLSVLVSDAFLEAVQAEADWPLVFPLDAGSGKAAGKDVIWRP
jgi:Ribonucleotide reductase, barrel domain/Ribonucleotide reductase, all-alpha domain